MGGVTVLILDGGAEVGVMKSWPDTDGGPPLRKAFRLERHGRSVEDCRNEGVKRLDEWKKARNI